MSPTEYLAAIGRSWWIIVLLAVLGGGAAFAYSSALPDTYRASAAVLVTSDGGSTTSELVQGSNYIENLVGTYVLLAESQLVLQPVIDSLGIDATADQLAGTVTASSPLNSQIIEIDVTSRSPVLARQVADATVASLTQVVEEDVSPTAEDGTPTVRLTTIQSSTEPRFPIAPNTRLDTMLGIAAGIVLGLVIAVARAILWRTIRSSRDVATVTTAPVVGEIVETRGGMTLPAAILNDRLGIEAESMRSFAANLNFLSMGSGLRSFVVTSASPQEAKSSTVTALGIILAERGQRVLIVDADLRHPSLAAITQLEPTVGLTDVLLGEYPLDVAVQSWAHDDLHVLTAGAIPPNPSQLLASDRMRKFLDDARSQYDMVVIDSAPLLSVSDAKWLGNMTDGALLVARHAHTSTRALRRLIEALETSAVPVLGIVLSRLPRRVRARYGDAQYGDAPRTRPRPRSRGAHASAVR